jgi:hypothetical protein
MPGGYYIITKYQHDRCLITSVNRLRGASRHVPNNLGLTHIADLTFDTKHIFALELPPNMLHARTPTLANLDVEWDLEHEVMMCDQNATFLRTVA